MPQERKQKQPLNPYLKYSTIGFQMIGSLALTSWIGNYLDGKMGNEKPLLTLAFMLFGVGASIYLLIRSVSKE